MTTRPAVTAAQVHDIVMRLIAAGHWREGDPEVLGIFDAGCDITWLFYLLADLPAQVLISVLTPHTRPAAQRPGDAVACIAATPSLPVAIPSVQRLGSPHPVR